MSLYYFSILSILTYFWVGLTQGLSLIGKIHYSKIRYYTGSGVGVLCHTAVLYQLIETPFGQNLHWLTMLSFTFLLMNMATVLFSFRIRRENLCVLTYPLTAFIMIGTLYSGGEEIILTKTKPDMLAHIFISFFALSLLMLAGLQAILMGVQNYLLKHQTPSSILRILPPLQSMENLLFNIILVGMLFLSASLISGFFFSRELIFILLPKMLLAISGWLLLAFLLIGRQFFGWRGPTAVRWTLAGTLLAFLSYFGTKAFLA